MKLNAKGIFVRANKPVGDFFDVTISSDNMDPDDGYMEFAVTTADGDELYSAPISFPPGVIVDERLWADWFQYVVTTRGGEIIPSPKRQKYYGVNRITTRDCIGNLFLRFHRDKSDLIILVADEKLLNRRHMVIKHTVLSKASDRDERMRVYAYRDHVRITGTSSSGQNDVRTVSYRGVFDIPEPFTDIGIVSTLVSGGEFVARDLKPSDARPDLDPVFKIKTIFGFEYLELSNGSMKMALGGDVHVNNRLAWILFENHSKMSDDNKKLFLGLNAVASLKDRIEKMFNLLETMSHA